MAEPRVERRPDGWYDTSAERFIPLLQHLYRRGGFHDNYQELLRIVDDLLRRGAVQ